MADKENTDPEGSREFTDSQRMCVALLKDKQVKYPELKEKFLEKWPGTQPPSRRGAYSMWKELNSRYTVKDERKGNFGILRTGRSEENIKAVKELLASEITKQPDEIGSSSRRDSVSLSSATSNRICRQDLNLRPYKLLRVQKITEHNKEMRLNMARLLSRKPNEYYRNLCVSDEAWFTLGGHVFNRKNTVIYSPHGQGIPEQWKSESSQAQ